MLIIYPCWVMGNASHWHPVGNLQLLLRSSVWPLLERLCVCGVWRWSHRACSSPWGEQRRFCPAFGASCSMVDFQELTARLIQLECLSKSWTHSELDRLRITETKKQWNKVLMHATPAWIQFTNTRRALGWDQEAWFNYLHGLKLLDQSWCTCVSSIW